MADSQVSQYRREQEQAERYYSADDLDACFEPDEEEPTETEEDGREPDYDYVPYEETAKYREEMIDAGRGHLLR